jgi:hypothetical protein
MAHNRLFLWKEPKKSCRFKVLQDASFGESAARCIQSGALFAEGTIIRAVSMMIFFNKVTLQARRVVVVNDLFVCAVVCFH